jgi:GTPase involved in cell partitioning and DNA repair
MKKNTGKSKNVVGFKEIIDQKKMNEMCTLDFDEFKFVVTRILLSIVDAMGENNKKIDESFERLIEYLKTVNEELKFTKQVLFMERILNGEHRDGPMTIEKKTSLAKSFGIDFDKFANQVTGKKKSSMRKKSTNPQAAKERQ